MKSARTALPKPMALPPSYDSFFSFPTRKSGYSGVGTYTRSESVIPFKAEEGLTGMLQPKPPLTAEERVSKLGTYPRDVLAAEARGPPDESEMDYVDLDSEGRTVVIDFGMFVLINVYCPNDGNGTEERDKYKMDFHRLLEARVKGLIEMEHRQVIVVGDLNACAAVDDHCEGSLMAARGRAEGMEGDDGFWTKDAYRWLRDWIESEDGSKGYMIDIVRRFWPERKGMYTCGSCLNSSLPTCFVCSFFGIGWNTKISARDSNYGTRIDYILITHGLLPWIKAADIQPGVKGSDHCPVYIDLHDEIIDGQGSTIRLRDVLGFKSGLNGNREPPRLAAKFWDEYSGKQTLLDKFFSKKGSTLSTMPPSADPGDNPNIEPPTSIPTPETEQLTSISSALEAGPSQHQADATVDPPFESSSRASSLPSTQSSQPGSSQPHTPIPSDSTNSTSTVKRKLTVDAPAPTLNPKRLKQQEKQKEPGQKKLSTFFAKPKIPAASSDSKPASEQVSEVVDVDAESDEEADYRLALLLSQESDPEQIFQPPSSSVVALAETKKAWSSLLAPVQPPRCIVHGELAKELRVNKPGLNKGKNFFICSR